MKTKIILLSFMLISAVAFSQVKDLTGSGQALTKSTTYSFYDAVSSLGTPFSLHVYSSGSVDDTTAVTIWQSNTTTGTGAWEQLGTSYTLVPSDTSKFITDTLWGKRIKLKIVSGNNDSTGYVYGKIFYGVLK